ncbi:MAG: hypothetical protein ACREJX_21005, partial [Polyangiaceae bacterium]
IGDGVTIEYNTGFSSVSAITSGSAADAGASIVACATAITLGPFPPFSTASASVTLYQGLGTIGSTTCRATIVPSQNTQATCDPVNPP